MWATVFRWSGRLIGGIGVLMWTLALVAQTFVEPIEDSHDAAAAGLVALYVINVLAFAEGVRSERRGGMALLIGGAALSLFAAFTAGHDYWLAALVSGGPFIAAGALFLLATHVDAHEAAITAT